MTTPDQYAILIEPAPDGGYGAWAPDLPGCVALGETVENAEREMRTAIEFHLNGMRVAGDPIPEPQWSTGGAYLRVPA